MKKIIHFAFVIVLMNSTNTYAQTTISGLNADKIISGAQIIRTTKTSKVPEFIEFRKDKQKQFSGFENSFRSLLGVAESSGLKLISTEKDKLGMTHYRYQQMFNNIPVEGTMYIVHTKNNKIISMNGLLYDNLKNISATAGIDESSALTEALKYSNAELFRWQVAAHEKQIKETTKNNNATYFPKGELVYAGVYSSYKATSYKLAYKFDIYCEKPFKRNYVFVDASTGKIVLEKNRIETTNLPATAYTAYSGIRTIITDSFATSTYRLQETGRGNGIITYNNLTAANPTGTTDFTNATTSWNNVNAQHDQYATDAHWGAEKTYDFYDSICNRNSIDDLGFQLISYVHVDVNLVNAFWDGQEMSYGDGNAGLGYTPLTTLDVAGHEISHGLTNFTSNLGNVPEGGAMNEGFSDCMGVSIRQFALHSSTMDWFIGDLIGGTPFRDMADPNTLQNPDTYFGQYWDSTTQEVHQNSTVFSHCFYLVSVGGSGTNDIGNAYTVSALGLDKAIQIWFRMNTIYLNSNSDYAQARTYAIQAAVDLYGGCSAEVISVTNAWYAVGIGGAYVPDVTVCNFGASPTSYCTLPATVNFVNTTTNGGIYVWDFGDGDTSSVMNPSHIYNTAGNYTVKLMTTGGCNSDSLENTNYILINPPVTPTVVSPVYISCGNTATLTAIGSNLNWYNSPIGTVLDTSNTFTTPILNTSTMYYVQSVVTSPNVFNTPLDNTLGTGSNNTSDHYLIFDVHQPCTLVSVLVYANGAGNRTITLNDAGGTILQTATINIPDGQSRITLNFPLTIGNNFQLECAVSPNLYRNSASAAYPYSDPAGLVTITGNDVSDPGRYYFFYNWELTPAPCFSAIIGVVVIVSGGVIPSFTYSQTGAVFAFSNSSSGGSSYVWDFGDGTTDTAASPVHNYAAAGTYLVTLTVSNGSCTDTTTQTVTIDFTGINSYSINDNLNIYPNPSTGLFYVSSTTLPIVNIAVYNIIGECVFQNESKCLKTKINLSAKAKGIYFLQIKEEDNKIITKKIIVQ